MSLLGALGLGAASALGNAIFQGYQGSQQLERNKDLMLYQSQLQQKNQRELLRSQIPLQVSSMRSAGLNPAFSQGSVSLGGLSAPLPDASTGIPNGLPLDFLGNMERMNNIELQNANKELVESQSHYYDELAGKTRSETDLLDSENMVFFERFEADLARTISESLMNRSGVSVNDEKIQEIKQNVSYLAQAENELMSRIRQNDAITRLKGKEADAYNSYIYSVIQQNLSSASFMSGQDQRQAASLMYELFNTSALTRYYESQSNLLESNKKLQDFTFKLQQKYGEAQQWINMVTDVAGSVGSVVGSAAGAFFGAGGAMRYLNKPASIRGFGR